VANQNKKDESVVVKLGLSIGESVFDVGLRGHGSYDGLEYKFNNVGPDLNRCRFPANFFQP